MLGSGAHVKIGTKEYLLDESREDSYTHTLSPRELGASEIIGSSIDGVPGKVSLKENKILWTWDDWSGGEGNRVYYPDEPTKYSYAEGLNPRVRGQLTGRPARTRNTDISTQTRVYKPFFAVGGGSLWVLKPMYDNGVSYQLAWEHTENGTSFTEVLSAAAAAYAEYIPTAFTADGENTYSAYVNYISIERYVVKRANDGTLTQSTSDGLDIPYAGIAQLGAYIYMWDGVKLWRLALTAINAAPEQVSPQTTATPAAYAWNEEYWANMVAADNQLVMFYTTNGFSKVYEFHEDRGFSEIWNAPAGFSIKSICYQNGTTYALGHWGADATADIQGFGAMYAINMDNRQAEFISFFRKEVIGDLQMMEMAPSYGNQIMIASAKTGRIFIYDADLRAVSMLDDLNSTRFGTSANNTDSASFTDNDHRIAALATFGNKRFAMLYRPDSANATDTFPVHAWSNDEPDNRQASTSTGTTYSMSWYSGEFDLGFPNEGKLLHGVHIAYDVDDSGTTSGLDDGQQIVVEISLDDATDVTLATLTSASTPSSGIKGRTFVSDLSNNRKFYKGRIKVTLKGIRTSSVNYQPPVLKAVTLETSLDDYEETWDLVLRTKSELPGERPSPRNLSASKLRDNIEDLIQNQDSVTFLDGARYQKKGQYTTHTVTVEKVVDSIERNAEGSMRVRLRAVSQ